MLGGRRRDTGRGLHRMRRRRNTIVNRRSMMRVWGGVDTMNTTGSEWMVDIVLCKHGTPGRRETIARCCMRGLWVIKYILSQYIQSIHRGGCMRSFSKYPAVQILHRPRNIKITLNQTPGFRT